MSANKERLQLILLRILGILLIIVGFTMIAQRVEGTNRSEVRQRHTMVARSSDPGDRCRWMRVEVHAPRPPVPPKPPAPPVF